MAQVLHLVRGVAVSVLIGVFVFAVVLAIGLVEAASPAVFAVGAGAGIVVGLTARGPRGPAVAGAVLLALVAVGLGVGTGFGALEFGLILGALASALWILAGEPMTTTQSGRLWMLASVGVIVVVVLPLVLDGGSLGHDESAYALKARQWLEGTPGSGWSSHRGTGMSAYGYLVLRVGGSEAGLRMIGLAGAIGLVAGVWVLGRRLSSAAAGSIAAVGIVAGPALMFRSTEYLSDLPAAAMLVWCMVVVWSELGEREAPTYRLLWSVPLAITAFYLRYQSALSLLLIALVSLVLWWPKLRRRPGPAIVALTAGLVGLMPHFALALDLYGSPFGIVIHTGRNAVRAYVGEGLSHYWGQLPWELAGWMGPVAVATVLLGLVAGRGDKEVRTRYWFLLTPALAQIVILGLVSHGEPRFLFFPVALMVVAGSIAVDRWLIHGERRWGRAVALGLSAVLAGSVALSADYARDRVSSRSGSNQPVELAAEAIEQDAAGRSCGVMTSYAPQVTFYSGCVTALFAENLDPWAAVDSLPSEARYLLLIDGGKRQPTGSDLDGLLALTTGDPVRVDGARRSAVYYRFAD